MRPHSYLLVALLAVAALPPSASAQWRLTTSAGAYLPTREIGTVTPGTGSIPELRIEQREAFAVSASASRWFGDRAGIEATASWVLSDVEGRTEPYAVPLGSGDVMAGGSANAWLVPASARLLYRLTRGASPRLLYAGLGPAVVWSGGDAYRSDGSGVRIDRGTDLGASAVFGARSRLSDLVSLGVTADAYLYPVTLRVRDLSPQPTTYRTDSRFQTDLLLSIGLTIALPPR